MPGLLHDGGRGELVAWKTRLYTRLSLHGGGFQLPAAEGSTYGYDVRPGDLLLVVRGSCVGPSFLSRGPLVEQARGHHELEVVE